jgi:hypothetical protein
MPGYPCCCDPPPDTSPCAECNTDETPFAIVIDISGFGDDKCSNKADFNIGKLRIEQDEGSECTYTANLGSPKGGIGLVSSCSSANTDIEIKITLGAGKVEVLITNGDTASSDNNEFLFRKSGYTDPWDCCSELYGITAAYVSQTANGTGIFLGHDGSGATITLLCQYCQYCDEGELPEEWQVVISSGSIGMPNNCSDGECDTKAGTYVIDNTSNCSNSQTYVDSGWSDQTTTFLGPSHGTCTERDLIVSVAILSSGIRVRCAMSTLPPGANSDVTEWILSETMPIDCLTVSGLDIPYSSGGYSCDDSGVTCTLTAL